MIKRYLPHVLASTVLLLGGMAQVYAAADKQLTTTTDPNLIQRSFLNLDFSQPNIYVNYQQNGKSGSGAKNVALPEQLVTGWKTTHRVMTADNFWQAGRLIEIWRGQGAYANSTWQVANGGDYTSSSANQYAELNAEESSTLYQNVCLIQDESFNYSFKHTRRISTSEQASFSIGIVTDTTTNAARSYTSKQNIATTSGSSLYSWKPYSGTIKVSQASGVYSLGFQALTSGTQGNFLDDITITGLKPVVEFSANNGSAFENATGTVPLLFKMVGNVTSTAMPTLKFNIAYADSVPMVERAIYNVDYVLKKRNGATGTTFTELTVDDGLNYNTSTGEVTFSYKPDYNSGLNYEQGVEFNGLVLEFKDNKQSLGNKTLPIKFATMASVIPVALDTCSQASLNNSLNFTIEEDDTDLEIIKSLTSESLSKVYKDQYLAYTLELTNKTKVDADEVILKDNILANLAYETAGVNAATLSCEAITNEGTTSTCPTLPNDAVTKLFSSGGLNLGTIKGLAKYKFTLNKLKAKEDATGEYTGYVVNNALVTTTSTDIDSSNNTSTVKTMMATKTDLSNNKTGAPVTETGIGMFVIGKEGRTGSTPLWTQKSDSNTKVYFPLNIQNYGNLAQDYQLYASSSKIEPTLGTGDYSTLVKNSITPFSSGLKIEFYKADLAQCKTGISAQQITQLNVAANNTTQLCAVVTVYSSVTTTTNIWFAIESLQSGLADIILDAVIPQPKKRALELSNDQSAQVGIGGSYVFLHRLTNYGVENETKVKVNLNPVNRADGFLYTLFLDQNGNDTLDAGDTLLSGTETELSNIIEPNKSVTLLIKVEAPSTANNGMSSQVKLIAKPDNVGKDMTLADLSNTNLITVSPNQLKIMKSQFKVENCSMANAAAVINAMYTVQNENLKPNQCLIYRIMVKNTGSMALSNVVINDMYPAYTQQWALSGILPIVGSNGQNITDSSNNTIQDDGNAKIKTILKELLSQQEKSLYFGIKMQ
ncbi:MULTISPECIES: hypothetical protein [Acinetobacter]|nr:MULTISPECIES: hypothetical protein [Acinetobacter]